MIIKVCGMKNADNIRQLDSLRPDITGFIFYEKSPRFVSSLPCFLPLHSSRAGVFVNQTPEYILHKAREFRLDTIQLHGQESPDLCLSLRNKGFNVIKAFHIPAGKPLCEEITRDIVSVNSITAPYEGICRYFLFDTSCKEYGGSGKTFDWDILNSYNGNTPFLLSGGISPGSIKDLEKFHHRKLAGVDINSGFETSPGIKDIELIRQFMVQLRQLKD